MEIEYWVDKIEGLRNEAWLYVTVNVDVSHEVASLLPDFRLKLELPLPQDFSRSIDVARDLALAAAKRVVDEAAIAALCGVERSKDVAGIFT